MTIPNENVESSNAVLQPLATEGQQENAAEQIDETGLTQPLNATEQPVNAKQLAESPSEQPAEAMSTEERALYAKMRREQETREKEAANEALNSFIKEKYTGYTKPLTGGTVLTREDFEDFEAQVELQKQIESGEMNAFEAQKLVIQRERERLLNDDPEIRRIKQENEEYRQKEIYDLMNRDLKAIQKLNPQIKSLNQLGERFNKMISAGVDAVDAYNLLAASREKVIPSPGEINSSKADKSEFYSREEVEAMTSEQIEKNLDKIMQSQSTWK